MVYVCLLRGINVGGHQMKMDQLRELFTELGYTEVRTFIQSGNVVFRSKKAVSQAKIEKAIEDRFGFHSDAILRTRDEMLAVIEKSAFAGRESSLNPGYLTVTFLNKTPDAASLEGFDAAGEELHLRGRELYAYFHNGIGKTTLKFNALAKRLGEPGTTRNWNTVLKLAELTEALPSASKSSITS